MLSGVCEVLPLRVVGASQRDGSPLRCPAPNELGPGLNRPTAVALRALSST